MNYVLMAGGVGERLWPLSSAERPKQFHAVVGKEPMVVSAARRVQKAGGDVYLATAERYAPFLRELLPEVPAQRYIIEPARRDTGPAMAYAAMVLAKTQPQEPVAFIPADHMIKNEARFLETLRLAERIIREEGKMVDIGVPVKFPSTVLGYTHIGRKEQRDGIVVYEFLGHTEKPSLERAREFQKSGEYLWHASYYMWTPEKIIAALKRYAPALYEGVKRSLEKPEQFEKVEKISFDYAITEHMDPKDVTILGGDFGWSDVGAWDVLYDELKSQDGANVVRGAVTALDCEGSFIHSETDRPVGVIGLRDMVVVDTAQGLLVCPRERAQDVKKLLGML